MRKDLSKISSVWPYLLRAYHAWMNDNQLTPHILVNAEIEGVEVPMNYVSQGQIVLNVSLDAMLSFDFSSDPFRFSATFQGVIQHITLPVCSIIQLFCKETLEGISIPIELLKSPQSTYKVKKSTVSKKISDSEDSILKQNANLLPDESFFRVIK